MSRIFLSKLLVPSVAEFVARPRLLAGTMPRTLILQAPSGSGKTVFLAQWLAAQQAPALYYQLDEQDQDGRVFAAHLLAGFRRRWPDWTPPDGLEEDPALLAAEVVNEAVGRPALILALDRLEAAAGQAHLADFLAVLVRYAPPTLTLAMATRAPLPVELGGPGRPARLVTAADLALSGEEAEAWLGAGEWADCFRATGGFPLALSFWQHAGTRWRAALAAHALAEMPRHIPADVARALVDEWTGGRLPLASFAHQVSQGQPGAERLWADAQGVRDLLLLGDFATVRERLLQLWDEARASGDRALVGAVALLEGELYYSHGDYAMALEWYHQAFEADPLLETVGTHSVVSIHKDQGHLAEAEALGLRCIEARQARGDMQALAYAHAQYAGVCAELGRLAEAEHHYEEAERIGLRLSGEPFYGILAMAQRSVVQLLRGNPGGYRRLAEEALAHARRRSPWLEAICAYVLAPALLAWGEKEAGTALLDKALLYVSDIDAKWQLHMVQMILAGHAWRSGRHAEAREHFETALRLAAREGYVQYLQGHRSGVLDFMLDAIVRGVEVPFCQELLVRMGERALPSLLAWTKQLEPQVRRASLYPLATIGGEAAAEAIRHLLYDVDEAVRDGAIIALKTMGQARGGVAPGVTTGDLRVGGPATLVAAAAQAVAAAGAAGVADGAAGVAAGAAGVAPAPGSADAGVRLAVALLGPMTVAAGGQPVTGWRTVKARDLLAYLVLGGDRPVTRDQIVEALWPEADPESGQTLLHTSLYQLRRALKPAGDGVINFAGGAYRLDRQGLDVDLERFQRLAAAGGADAWRQAAALYRGDLLEGTDYPWCEAPRIRARTTYLDVLRNLAQHFESANQPGQAIPWLQLLIQVDPLSEDGHTGLMACYADTGNRGAALQQYRTLAHLLDEELGLEPSVAARQLYRRLLG